jgi:hypothetical protein
MRHGRGFANPAVAGYLSRGRHGGTIYKWAFPSNTVSTTTVAGATLGTDANSHGGFSHPGVAGYMSRFGNVNIYKWSFPSDTVSTTTSAPAAPNRNDGFSNSVVAGYFARGNGTSTIYKWTFPADTVTTTTSAPNNLGDASFRGTTGFANA